MWLENYIKCRIIFFNLCICIDLQITIFNSKNMFQKITG